LWWDILKEAKLSGRAKGSTLDTNRIKIKTDDNECNKQLKAWADKMKNIAPILPREYSNNKWFSKHFGKGRYYEEDGFAEWGNNYKYELKDNRDLFGDSDYMSTSVSESYTYTYNPIPEKVACRAIEMMKTGVVSKQHWRSEGAKEPLNEIVMGHRIRFFYRHNSPLEYLASLEINLESKPINDYSEPLVDIGVSYNQGEDKFAPMDIEIREEISKILGYDTLPPKWWE